MEHKSLERESLTCPICLDLLLDPVTIPCGHSFCMNCIKRYWPHSSERCKCPQCRKRFRFRPHLNKNIMLAELVEQIETANLANYARPQDVPCDECTEKKLKAVKSCVQCVKSFCQSHLKPHLDVVMLQKHQLVAPSKALQENICSDHNEVKKMFCNTDQLPVCVVCCMGQHTDHDVVFSADERAKRQAELEANMDLLKNRIVHKEGDLQRLLKRNMDCSQSAQSAELHCKNTITEITDLLSNILEDIHQHIALQMRMEKNQSRNIQDKLSEEISNLKKRVKEMTKLAKTKEHNYFLQQYSSTASPSTATSHAQPTDTKEDSASDDVLKKPPINFDYLIREMQALREKFTLTLSNLKLPEPEVSQSGGQPITRKDLLCYRREIILDLNTAHPLMLVSDRQRKVTYMSKGVNPNSPFIYGHVLSKSGLIGRSYWEVEVSLARYVCIAVSYKDFDRANNTNCVFGRDNTSWALQCDNTKYLYRFDSVQSDIVGPVRPRIGVYLDHSAGVLSFYSVSNNLITLLHKVQTNFTQPLYVGLSLRHHADSAAFAKLTLAENHFDM